MWRFVYNSSDTYHLSVHSHTTQNDDLICKLNYGANVSVCEWMQWMEVGRCMLMVGMGACELSRLVHVSELRVVYVNEWMDG